MATLTSFAATIKEGSALKNKVADAGSALSSALGGLNGAFLSAEDRVLVTRLTKALTEHAEATTKRIAELPFKLPLLKAADELADKAKLMDGATPALNGGAGVNSLIDIITVPAEQLAALSSSAKNTLNGITASLPVIEADDPPPVPGAFSAALASIGASIDQHVAAAETAATHSTAVMKSSIENLKAFAFARFCSTAQPAHIRTLLEEVVSPGAIPNTELVHLDEVSSGLVTRKRYAVAHLPLSPTITRLEEPALATAVTATADKSAPTIHGKTLAAFKEEFTRFYGVKVAERDQAKAVCEAATQAVTAHRNAMYPEYLVVKEKALAGDAAAKVRYSTSKDAFTKTAQYTVWLANNDRWETLKVEVQRLADLWTEWAMHDYANAAPGPVW